MSLPYWSDLGWETEVLAVNSKQVAAPLDPFLTDLLPDAVEITRVSALGLIWSRIPGLGTLGYRARRAIYAALFQKLSSADGRSTTVYFSTTQFPILGIIPKMKRRFPDVSFVIDYQDPWVNDYYQEHSEIKPPGGKFKFGVEQYIARRMEAAVLPYVSGITTVSAKYREDICRRIPWVEKIPWLELPFGGAKNDFRALAGFNIKQTYFPKNDGHVHWVYVGRGGADLEFSARALFRALKIARDQSPQFNLVRLHFIGTDYAPAHLARPTLKPVAEAEGVAEFVTEYPRRIPYSHALQCLVEADALVIPGSLDSGYSASKVYPYILANRPLLALYHRESPVHQIIRNCEAGTTLAFDDTTTVEKLASEILAHWFDEESSRLSANTKWAAFERYTDESMTSRLSEFLGNIGNRPTCL